LDPSQGADHDHCFTPPTQLIGAGGVKRASSAHWAACCGRVRARSSISDGRSLGLAIEQTSGPLRKVGLKPRIPKRDSVDFIRFTIRVRSPTSFSRSRWGHFASSSSTPPCCSCVFHPAASPEMRASTAPYQGGGSWRVGARLKRRYSRGG
jgi:hypothetical protein